jgi:Calpain family cysteine protease
MTISADQCRYGRLPGVVGLQEGAGGLTHIDSQTALQNLRGPVGLLVAANTPAVASTQLIYKLPPPETSISSHLSRLAKRCMWKKLFDKKIRPGDVQQQNILNCYLAATLAALANAPKGDALLRSMVKQKAGKITTICYNYASGGAKGKQKKITSNRYFVVRFSKKKKIVSDVLYLNDSDRDPDPRYMTSPRNYLWPCIIEVAYASLKGSYDKLDYSNGVSLNKCISDLTGKSFSVLDFATKKRFSGGRNIKLTDAHVTAACRNAVISPVIAPSTTSANMVTRSHAYAVIAMRGHKVALYDPLAVKVVQLTIKELQANFQALFVVNV